DRRDLIIDGQVVARRRAVALDDDRLAVKRARDQAGNELVDRLARAVGGGRARDDNGDPVAGLVGAGQGLRGGPRRSRQAFGGEPILLAIGGRLQRPVNLAAADQQEALVLELPGRLEQHHGALDVGPREGRPIPGSRRHPRPEGGGSGACPRSKKRRRIPYLVASRTPQRRRSWRAPPRAPPGSSRPALAPAVPR